MESDTDRFIIDHYSAIQYYKQSIKDYELQLEIDPEVYNVTINRPFCSSITIFCDIVHI